MEKNTEFDNELIKTVKRGKEYKAVKDCMDFYGITLKEAKVYINDLTKDIKKQPSKTGTAITFGVFILIIVVIISAVTNGESNSAPDSYVSASVDSVKHKLYVEAQFSNWDGSHIKTVEVIKNSMNDPNSFEHIETLYRDNGDNGLFIQTTFTGKNAFGGTVKETYFSIVDTTGQVIDLYDSEQ